MPPSSQNPTRQIVGRGAQLAVVAAHVTDLERSRGGLVLMTGEPGIGKTRLAEEIVGLGRERGARPVWATAWQGDGAPPLWPWVQVLRQLAGSEQTLAQFMAASPGASPGARFAQSEAVANVIRTESMSDPIIVVIDDLQWADSATIRILAAVAAQLRDVGCLFVGTYRPDELASEHVAELARVGVTLAVPPLTGVEAAELLNIAVGSTISSVARDSIIERSGGNPLFVWEFGQLLAQSGRFDVAPAAVPVAVVAVIGRRLARLPEDGVALLRAGAVAGNPFTAEVVDGITHVGLSEAVGGLEAAAAVGLLAQAANGYQFSHDLIRDVVLDGIDPVRRAELHLGAASAFEERLMVDDSFYAVVADHLEQAGPIHAEAAAVHWELAARRAQRVLAFDEAAFCFARAARNCLQDDRRVAVLLVEEGEALLLAGELEHARARFLAGAKLARSIAEPELLARSVLGMGAGPVAWEVPIASNEQASLVADALERLPDDATALRSMLLARLSVAAATPETVSISRQRAAEAFELAQSAGDPALIAQALAALNDAYAGPAHTMTRRDNADTIVELAVVAGDRVLELLGYRYRIVADLEIGDIAAVDRNIAAFTRLAEQLRQPLVSWYVPLFRGMRTLLGGDLDGAERWCGDVALAAEATASHNAAMMAATLALGIDAARGRAPDPAALEGLFEVDPAEWASYAAGLAMVHWLAGDRVRARHLLKLHADNGFTRLGEDGEQLTTLLMFGRIATGLEEAADCEALYALLLPHAGLWAVDGIAGCCWGPIELELGRLALALGRRADALEHLGRARATADQVGAPLIGAEAASLEKRCGRVDATETGAEIEIDERNVFRRDGQFWTLSYRGRIVRMKDAKGLQDLAKLLSMPGNEIHVLDLAGNRAEPTRHALGRSGDLGDVLDARARAEYRRRLAELDDDVADAEQFADLGRAEKARAERDFIATELAAALGLGGRPRRTGDPAERARKAVAGRIRLTIGRIDQEAPDLARHLANAVHTGTFCVYRPEVPIDWML
jgi:tetratricopeptide (TPR) repeat protein